MQVPGFNQEYFSLEWKPAATFIAE